MEKPRAARTPHPASGSCNLPQACHPLRTAVVNSKLSPGNEDTTASWSWSTWTLLHPTADPPRSSESLNRK
ncbi:hypothetical protein HPB50_016562 [Hyalomma asiaticum]|uniref:Uncharacterized protein n=1 Tax=Hyalomma asiaticum TaxID=266040 RepID=A0ACB7S811_HYAAI|nr:hypothetical protein HPB50_016562 [Hyalomma asiaticum]